MSRLAIFGMAFVVMTASVGSSFVIQKQIEHKTITVESKERLLDISNSDSGTSTSYINFVYSDDETYVVADSFWNWHFRARTIYAQIPENGVCDVTLSGVRWGFFSMHQNIIEAKCTK